jgi:hypothetical protein
LGTTSTTPSRFGLVGDRVDLGVRCHRLLDLRCRVDGRPEVRPVQQELIDLPQEMASGGLAASRRAILGELLQGAHCEEGAV